MNRRLLLPILIVIACSAPRTSAQESISIGKLKVRADSPLARGEHPRLLITRGQLPRIRARLKNPEIQKYLQEAQDLTKADKATPLLLAVLYQVTGDGQYADLAKKNLGAPEWTPEWSFTFDLLADSMTDAELNDYAAQIVKTLKDTPWRLHVLLALAAWGHGKDAELVPFIEQGFRHDVMKAFERCNGWSAGRGGSSMGHGYNGEHFYSIPFAAIVGWSHATGEDLISKADFSDQTPAWYIYHYRPDDPRRVMRIGVTAVPAHIRSTTPSIYTGADLVMLSVTRTRNGLGQWWEREYIGDVPLRKRPEAERHKYGLWGRILWLDPSIPSIPPEKFPPTRLFPVNGHVIMRSDWSKDATVALFRCGRFGPMDGPWGRGNADNLHFIILKEGTLAPETGCVHTLNTYGFKMATKRNIYDYGRQTIAHNSITVGRDDLGQSGGKAVIRRGGQTPIQPRDWYAKWGLPDPKLGQPFQEGRIVAYETSPDFDYACGDATYSYPPERVKSITRQFVYLKPDTFVIFDRVVPVKTDDEVIWNLHALKEPTWNGLRAPDPSWTPERQFILSPEGERIPNPHPGGHFLHTKGDTFRITDGGGELDVKILLPPAGTRVVRTIGGPWHDFEVNGVNYGPTEATYRAKYRHLDVGVGGWRIEVARKGPAKEVYFLHVLKVGKRGEFRPVDASLIEQPERFGATIRENNKTWTVLFDKAGKPAGRIKSTEGERVLIDEALVTQVEDDYDRWRADPRYDEWMNNEYMRAVIFPHGMKRK